MPEPHPLHEQLAAMNRNFAKIGEQITVAAEQMTEGLREVGQTALKINRELTRLSGQTAARMDWQGTLWPGSVHPARPQHEPFCADCPDREACMGGYPCEVVRAVAEDQNLRE